MESVDIASITHIVNLNDGQFIRHWIDVGYDLQDLLAEGYKILSQSTSHVVIQSIHKPAWYKIVKLK